MRKTILLLAVLLAAAGLWRAYSTDRFDLPKPIERAAEDAISTVQETAKGISAPPPLRATVQSPKAYLTREGVLKWTNANRAEDGASTLVFNAKLNSAAEAKLKDMFDKQYFEHVSPDGIGPGELADRAGYAYVLVGENLALGNYANDQALVQAWMDSPGHRANILNASYSEIGVAVGRGTFEGQTTWLAVQEFGRPLSACPQPDASLKAKTDADKAALEQMKDEADRLKAEIDASRKPKTQEQADAYNANVDRYNQLARQINELIAQIQGEITVYNGQVQAFNACANG